jgi:hypothetical protein
VRPDEEWLEQMFGKGNWVVADSVTIRAIQADALRHAARIGINLPIRSEQHSESVVEFATAIITEADRIEKGSK